MKDEEGKTYVVEVNGNPGTKVINLTGHNYFVDLVKLIERKVGKSEQGNTENASASNGIVGNIKATIFGQRTDPYANLSAQEIARAENIKRLKSKYPRLMNNFLKRKAPSLHTITCKVGISINLVYL